MAHIESGELHPSQSYTLGDYRFSLERDSVPGTSNDRITAFCRKGTSFAAKSLQVSSSTVIDSWCVEANDNTAIVYINKKYNDSELITGDLKYSEFPPGRTYANESHTMYIESNYSVRMTKNGGYAVCSINGVVPDSSPGSGVRYPVLYWDRSGGSRPPAYYYTYNDQTVTYFSLSLSGDDVPNDVSRAMVQNGMIPTSNVTPQNNPKVAWSMWHNVLESKDIIVGRFRIDIKDAGGTGSESAWSDPVDWNADPSKVLNINIVGALSGRHNDPLNDTSYSYLPSDQPKKSEYGCGGDGGHGGGGGAGASTVVVEQFATDKANWKNISAYAKRHGYGSGGGKGGDGGDGMILIYY